MLGKIVRVRREMDEIEVGTKKKTTEAVESVVLRPARWSEG
jgi:hypothetical protein